MEKDIILGDIVERWKVKGEEVWLRRTREAVVKRRRVEGGGVWLKRSEEVGVE